MSDRARIEFTVGFWACLVCSNVGFAADKSAMGWFWLAMAVLHLVPGIVLQLRDTSLWAKFW